MKYAFMRSHADQFSLMGMCRVLSVSRSGYYAWRCRGPSARKREDLTLAAHVRRIHNAAREAYGTRKVWKALVAEGITCGRHRVARRVAKTSPWTSSFFSEEKKLSAQALS